ncbi:MAG: hypothetical protein HC834_03750 [Rhodospirillales bacterium]|nr:hypothetical protein [Rhodospirillales bacterium]
MTNTPRVFNPERFKEKIFILWVKPYCVFFCESMLVTLVLAEPLAASFVFDVVPAPPVRFGDTANQSNDDWTATYFHHCDDDLAWAIFGRWDKLTRDLQSCTVAKRYI